VGLRSSFGPLAFDGAGNLYFFDYSTFRVLRWGAGGGLSTVAGTGVQGQIGSPPQGDGGPATAAAFTGANAMIVDVDGAILLAETGRPVVRRIDPDGTISTIVGGGETALKSAGGSDYAPDGTTATDLQLAHASGLAVDADGRLYVSDDANHVIVRFDDGAMELLVADQQGAVEDFDVPASSFRALTVGLLGWGAGGNDLLFGQANRILAIADAAGS
jgi:sugar lactone lactonase YvrE